jgi:predicted small lipoprotein YifL
MRGKKTALAIIVLILIAGGTLNIYMPDYDVVADDEQTQVTEGAGANVK